MQNNIIPIGLEFEISGEKLGEFEWSQINFLSEKEFEIGKAVHNVILKKAWEIISLEELRCALIKSLHFIDLIKIKLDFSENPPLRTKFKSGICICETALSPLNTIENLPNILSDNLFGWIYYNDDDTLKTFRFILDISTGEIKYLNN